MMISRLATTVRVKSVLVLGCVEKVCKRAPILAVSRFSSDKETAAKESANQPHLTSSEAPHIRELSHEATVEEIQKSHEEQIHPDWIGLERRLSHRKPRPKSEIFT